MAPPAFTVPSTFLTNRGFFSFSILNPFSQAKVVSINRPVTPLSSSALTATPSWFSSFSSPTFIQTSLSGHRVCCTCLTLLVVLVQLNLFPSFSGHNILYRLLEASKSSLSSIFFCWLLWRFHYSSFMPFPAIFGYIAPLPTYITYPVSPSSFVYIHCIWISPWTHLSFPSIEYISFFSSSVPSSCSLHYLSPSSPIWSSFSWLHISPWVHRIDILTMLLVRNMVVSVRLSMTFILKVAPYVNWATEPDLQLLKSNLGPYDQRARNAGTIFCLSRQQPWTD